MRSRLAVAATLAAIAATLAPMLAIGFVNDDYTIVTFALHRGRPFLEALLSRAEVIEVYYRPLFDLSLKLDHVLWGWNPLGYRLTNLVLHLVNSALVLALARRLGFRTGAALVAALVFGLHPIHEMSLFWIAGRTDVLFSTFALGSLLFVVDAARDGRARDCALACAFAALAMLTKEMALGLPLVAAVIAWWTCRHEPVRSRTRSVATSALPIAATIALILVVRYVALDNDLFSGDAVHATVPLAQLARNVAMYIGLLVVPGGHEAIEGQLRASPWLVAAVSVPLLAAGLFLSWRWRRPLAPFLFCMTALVVSLVPVLRLVMRWYLYFPSVFFALGVGWLIADLARHSRRGALAAAAIIALAYGAIDLAAIDEWIDASRLAGRLAGALRATVGSVPAGDTLRFLTIPGKVAGTPVLNLGFAGTVRHVLDRDDVIVLIGSKLNMRRDSTRVDVVRDGGLTLHAARGEHFTVTSRALSARQRAPAPGDTLETELGPVVVDGVDETRRATGLRFQLARDSQRVLYTFDGERFRRVD